MHTAPPHQNRWTHAKALLALFWRMILLTPIVAIIGMLALIAVLGLSFILPFWAVVLVISGDYLWAVVVAAAWLVWLRFGGPVRRFVYEGFEHGSI